MSSDVVALYLPYVDDLREVLARREETELLVIGAEIPDVVHMTSGTRWTADMPDGLPGGVYVFDLSEGQCVVDARNGAPTRDPSEATVDQMMNDHPLTAAWEWREELWRTAEQVAKPRFAIGELVLVNPKGSDGTVADRFCLRGGWTYRVRTEGRSLNVPEARLEQPVPDDDPLEWVTRTPAPAEEIAATLTQKKLDANLTSTVFSFRTTRTTFRPYQFKPVLKLLDSGISRMLIADEVGLGKTIEAGLVWTELEARRRADRVLVLCPSSLVSKWQREMEDRFGFELVELDGAGLERIVADLETGKPQRRVSWVCSVERMRTWGGLPDAVRLGLTFDVILVDEAHSMRNRTSKTYALGATLDSLSESVIFLSATPLNLGNHDLLNLLDLLQPGEFPSLDILKERLVPNFFLQRIAQSLMDPTVDQASRREWFHQVSESRFGRTLLGRPEYQALAALLRKEILDHAEIALVKRYVAALHSLGSVLTRTRKVDVQEEKPVREPYSIEVQLTGPEREFIELFQDWCADRAKSVNQPMGFVMQMPLRLVSSCIPAAAQQVLGGPTSIEDLDAERAEPASQTAVVVPPSADLKRIARNLGGVDSKYDEFAVHIHRLVGQGHRVLVFTFSRATIAYLTRRLEQSQVRAAELHGGVRRDERHRVMKEFRERKFDVLVANRVASEGLDFEFCSAVINYDLPWNPMEVEQRIGRIDRIGQQQKKILAGYFHVPGTIETDIIERVMLRIEIFRRSIGELEPIVAGDLRRLKDAVFNFDLNVEQRRQRATEAAVAAVERQFAQEEVAQASDSVLSGDYGDIEGLEDDLMDSGRYVGPAELATLVRRWILGGGGHCVVTSKDITIKGDPGLADQVIQLATTGVRTRAEIENIARLLRNEEKFTLSLDWDSTREGGLDLLTPLHPLVLAAERRPAHRQARFGGVRIEGRFSVEPGLYLALLSEATWKGHKSSHEIWPAVVNVSTGRLLDDTVANALWADLARGTTADAALAEVNPAALRRSARAAMLAMLQRQSHEEEVRTEENQAFTAIREQTLALQHENRVRAIDNRLAGLKSASPEARRLFEHQRQKAHSQYEEQRLRIGEGASGTLDMSHFACVLVEVPAP